MNRRLVVSSVSVLVVSGVAGALYLRNFARAQDSDVRKKSVTAENPRLRVETVVSETTRRAATIRLTGRIEADRVSEVAAEAADRVLARLANRGDRVTGGAILIELNRDLARAALRQAEAAAERAAAARHQTEAELARATVETRAALSQALAQRETARAAEQKARSFTRSQELAQAEAALVAVRAEETLARKDYDRYELLVKEDTLPRQTLDRARAALDAVVARRESAEQTVSLAREGARAEDIAQAAAQVTAAEAGVEAARTRPQRLEVIRRQVEALRAQEREARAGVEQARIALSKRTVRAPFDGRVLETLVEPGEMVSPGRTVLRLADVRTVKAVFALPEAYRDRLSVGQRIEITADGVPGQRFAGVVRVVGHEADAAARTFAVEIEIVNPEERLLPGMVARIALPLAPKGDRPRVTIPVSAIASDGTRSYVFRIEGGYARRRDVTLGEPVGKDRVEIVRGLSGGEPIAAAPQRLTDNAAVEAAGNGSEISTGEVAR
ncbi:MAG: efflux RND transporter periplasmic adaptor subunit [Capsulimonadales bacterium]|nr:efflux RND transporter periplasmic adaptor subunit [Capsulimonadales bacterium]